MSRPNKPRTINAEANIAERITHERESRGWSYATLASKMTEVGCSIGTTAIFKVEKGTPRRRVTVDELVALSRVFGASIEDLLTPASEIERARMDAELVDDLNNAARALARFRGADA